MPIYEYLCKNCGNLLEVMQKISDPSPTECDKCHKGPLEKQMSMTSFALKGTGWYVTDFRGGSDKKAPPTSSAAATPASTSSETASTSTGGASEAKPQAAETPKASSPETK